MKQETYIKISDFVRQYPQGESIVKYANIIITRIVYLTYFVMLVTLAVWKDTRIFRVILVPAISFLIVSVFRYTIDAPRPYVLYTFNPIVKKDKKGQSMPSRHVFSTFVIGMSAWYVCPVAGILIFIAGIFMCVGRVVAGVHFPKDVIAGALIGIISGLIGFYLI
jgi:membrane-associated phospholipid phosphatase